MNVELTHDASEPGEFPRDGLPEVAILGRSNVGKSTLINALVGRKRLARTSRRPGKTRRIHFYRLDKSAYLVDLPGYGYAAVARQERRSWRGQVESYLLGSRTALHGALLVVDPRRGLETEELDLLDWLRVEQIEARLVLTKADKLKPREAARAAGRVAEQACLPPERLALVSGTTAKGLATVGRWLHAWTGLEIRRPDGAALLGWVTTRG